MSARDEMAVMLARQVLGAEDYRERHDHHVPFEASTGQVEVDINLRAMVHGMRQRIWIGSAAIAEQVETKLREAASEVNVDRMINEVVAEEVATARSQVRDIVRKKITSLIESEVAARAGVGPARLARRITDKMWDGLYGAVSKKGRR